jgi:hypothetical protein
MFNFELSKLFSNFSVEFDRTASGSEPVYRAIKSHFNQSLKLSEFFILDTNQIEFLT